MTGLKSRSIVLAGVAVALLGAVVVFVYTRSVTGVSSNESSASAYVASKDIGAGSRWEDVIKSASKRAVPASLYPASAVTKPDQLAGRTSVRTIAKGEVITTGQFGASEAAPGAGLEIPPKHNAVTMNVAAPQGVAHYVQTGDLVNIYTTIKQNGNSGSFTKLLLSNVQVLQNRSATTVDKEGVSGSGEVLLTLALTPDASEKLIYAKQNGQLWFALVRPGDRPATTAGRNATNVLN